MTGTETQYPNSQVTLEKGVYIAYFDGEFVLLDLNKDKYLGLDATASKMLAKLLGVESLSEKWVNPSNVSVESQKHKTFESLRSLGLVGQRQVTATPKLHIEVPEEAGGLTICDWRPHQSPLSVLSKRPSIWRILEALRMIAQANWILTRRRLRGLVEHIQRKVMNGQYSSRKSSLNSIANLHEAVQQARIWYPRKVDCLVGSGALLLMMLKRGVGGNLVVGVQKYPFYAHAWVEYCNTVVNDAEEAKRRLSVILRTPLF